MSSISSGSPASRDLLHRSREAEMPRREGGRFCGIEDRLPHQVVGQQAGPDFPPHLLRRLATQHIHAQPGFRVETLVIVTTLLDATRYPRTDLAELYHPRWLAELDLRAINVTAGNDGLRWQS